MATYVVTDPNTGRKVRLTGDTPPTDEDLDEIFSSLPAIEKSPTEIKADPYSGSGGMASQYGFDEQKYEQDKQAFDERLAALPPGQADLIRDMTPVERTLANVGAGMTDVYYGIPGMGDNPNLDTANMLTSATDGGLSRAVGQAAPFAPLGVAAQGLKAGAATLIPRAKGIIGAAARSAAIGGAEGATIAEGTGGDTGDVVQGGLVGAAIGGVSEVLAPAVNRLAGSLIRRFRGAAPSQPPIGADLTPSPELQEVMQEASVTIDDLVQQASSPELAQEVAGAATSGVDSRVAGLADQIETNPARVAAAERLGVDAPLATLTDQTPIQEIVGAAAAVPASRTNESLVQYSRELTRRAEDMVEQYSGYLDKEVVSENLKGNMQAQIQQLNDASRQIYDRIDEAVPRDTIVNAAPLRRELSRRGSASQRGVDGLSKVERDVYRKIQGKPTYFDIDRLRKDIGASIGRTEGTYTDEQVSILKDMYSKLSQLQEGVADQVGDGAGQLWSQVKELDRRRFSMQENSEFLFGQNNIGTVMPKLESSLQMLAKGSNQQFKQIIGSIPDEQRGAVLSSAIDSVIRKSYAGDVRLDANGFAKWYNQLGRSETNKRTLMSELPEGAEQRLDDLYQLAQGLANVTNNRVRTGVINSVFKDFDAADGLVAKLYGIADKVSENPVMAASVGPTFRVMASTAKMATKEKTPAIQAADELLSSPEFKTAVLSAGLPEKRAAVANRRLAQTDAYKKYLQRQSQSRAAAISSMGLIPFLTAEDEEE